MAVSRDFEGNLRLYYNGELTGPTGNVQTGSTTPTTDKGGFRLGHDTQNGNWPLQGYIDEAAVYKDSLEAEDVATMFSVGQRRVTN